jgi:hypothetical protein
MRYPMTVMMRLTWDDIYSLTKFLSYKYGIWKIVFVDNEILYATSFSMLEQYFYDYEDIMELEWEYINTYIRIEIENRSIRIKTYDLPLIADIRHLVSYKHFADLEISLSVM